MKCDVGEHYPLEAKECQGDVDEYYGTCGGLGALCQFHLKKAFHVVWDNEQPMSKAYCEEVYEPIGDFEDSLRKLMYEKFESETGFDQQACKDWLFTDEGLAWRSKIAQDIEDKRQELIIVFTQKVRVNQ